jgi:hypothetical protein
MATALRIPTIVLLLMTAACAMRVTGIVTDSTTRTAIGGAVLQAQDKRNRIYVTDPSGNYSVKTDGDTSAMIVSAPGYRTKVVTIAPGNRFPFIAVELERDGTFGSQSNQPSHRPVTTAEKLRDIESLYSNGSISKEEYKAMRARALEEN